MPGFEKDGWAPGLEGSGEAVCDNCGNAAMWHHGLTLECPAMTERKADAQTCAQDAVNLAEGPAPGEPEKSALDVQVGGSHYKDLKIQPVEYIHANNIPFIEGSVIKYMTRWRDKGGVEDLKKARHFIDMLIKLEQRE